MGDVFLGDFSESLLRLNVTEELIVYYGAYGCRELALSNMELNY